MFMEVDAALVRGRSAKTPKTSSLLVPPCQPYSGMRDKRKVDVDSHPQREVLDAAVEVIKDRRPFFSILENVAGLATSGEAALANVIRNLQKPGFQSKAFCLGNLCLPSDRPRIWIVVVDGRRTDAAAALKRVHDLVCSIVAALESVKGGLSDICLKSGDPDLAVDLNQTATSLSIIP